MNSKIYAIIGGDMRCAILYKLLAEQGFKVVSYGIFGINDTASDIEDVIDIADILILPIPFSKNGVTINAPNCTKPIYINELFSKITADKKVFAGSVDDNILKLADEFSVAITDYANDESFSLNNAVLTAEGAIQVAISNTDFSIFGSKCLILGFGRIGKVLARYMKALGANVTVAARKAHDLTHISIECYNPVNIYKLNNLHDFNIIFNTVPHLILTADILQEISKDCIIIDLASIPGGVDFSAAKKLNIKAVHSLGLPSIVAPKTAALIIRDTIFNYLREEGI